MYSTDLIEPVETGPPADCGVSPGNWTREKSTNLSLQNELHTNRVSIEAAVPRKGEVGCNLVPHTRLTVPQ